MVALHLANSVKRDSIVNMITAISCYSIQEHAALFNMNNLLQRGWLVSGAAGFDRLKRVEDDMATIKRNVSTIKEDVATIKRDLRKTLALVSKSGDKRPRNETSAEENN